jgi:SAM-dependent methyltransferase
VTGIAPCHICKSKDVKLVEVLNGLPAFDASNNYNLYSCNNCGTLFFHPFPEENFAELVSEVFDRLEIEYSAGLLFMASLIYPFRKMAIKNMLDVGCGLGFLSDIARETLNIERCVGVAPSYDKRMNIFDHEVLVGYYPEVMRDKEEWFDLIVSSEVLDHTHDPYEFLQNIANSLSDDGIAVLSTPNADSYFKEESEAERIALAGPGGHTILVSRRSLGMLLDRLGVEQKIVLSEGNIDLEIDYSNAAGKKKDRHNMKGSGFGRR